MGSIASYPISRQAIAGLSAFTNAGNGGVVLSGSATTAGGSAGHSNEPITIELLKSTSLPILALNQMFIPREKIAVRCNSSMYFDRINPLDRL